MSGPAWSDIPADIVPGMVVAETWKDRDGSIHLGLHRTVVCQEADGRWKLWTERSGQHSRQSEKTLRSKMKLVHAEVAP